MQQPQENHPLRHPRNAVILGIAFVVVAAVYFGAPKLFSGEVDFSGVTMLSALGIGMGFLAYVLISGSPRG